MQIINDIPKEITTFLNLDDRNNVSDTVANTVSRPAAATQSCNSPRFIFTRLITEYIICTDWVEEPNEAFRGRYAVRQMCFKKQPDGRYVNAYGEELDPQKIK